MEGQLGKLAKKVPGSGARGDHEKKTEKHGSVLYSLSSFSTGEDWPCFTK